MCECLLSFHEPRRPAKTSTLCSADTDTPDPWLAQKNKKARRMPERRRWGSFWWQTLRLGVYKSVTCLGRAKDFIFDMSATKLLLQCSSCGSVEHLLSDLQAKKTQTRSITSKCNTVRLVRGQKSIHCSLTVSANTHKQSNSLSAKRYKYYYYYCCCCCYCFYY